MHSAEFRKHPLVSHLIAQGHEGALYIEKGAGGQDLQLLWDSLPAEWVGMEGKPLVRVGERLYLQRLFSAEQRCMAQLQRLLCAPALPVVEPFWEQQLQEHRGLLTQEQLQVPLLWKEQATVLLTGGPGTGKTKTASSALKMVWKALSEAERDRARIVILAPTGKAALHLYRVIQTAFQGELEVPRMEVGTLHRFLQGGVLAHDIVVVDELSMVDIEWMARLAGAVLPGARLLLMGDPNQLSPVECAGCWPVLEGLALPRASLTRCLRTEHKELVALAEAVLAGATLDMLPQHPPCRSDALLDLLLPHFLQPKESLCLLTPLRRGPYGAESWNRQFLQKIEKLSPPPFHIPVLVARNDYHWDLFNGESAWLVRQGKEPSVEDRLHFLDGRSLPALLLPHCDIAYSMTVHKSQGSEFDHVALVLPRGAAVEKRLLYTAVTRAKKKLSIYPVL